MALAVHDGTGIASVHAVERHRYYERETRTFPEGWHCVLGCEQDEPGWDRHDLAWALAHVAAHQWTAQ